MQYRRFPSIFRAVLTPILLSTAGCAVQDQTNLPTPADREQLLFRSITSFYCEQKRWPATWSELESHVRQVDGSALLMTDFRQPTLRSPRALLLSVTYSAPETAKTRKVTFIAPPACDGDAESGVVSILGGRVRFDELDGFEVLDGEAVKARWGKGPYPDVAWERSESGVVIAIRFGEAEVSPDGLAELKRGLEDAYDQTVNGIRWIAKRDVQDMRPRRLVHEFESDSSKGRLVTESMSLSLDGRLLTINVIGPVGARGEIESVFEGISSSLAVDGDSSRMMDSGS